MKSLALLAFLGLVLAAAARGEVQSKLESNLVSPYKDKFFSLRFDPLHVRPPMSHWRRRLPVRGVGVPAGQRLRRRRRQLRPRREQGLPGAVPGVRGGRVLHRVRGGGGTPVHLLVAVN